MTVKNKISAKTRNKDNKDNSIKNKSILSKTDKSLTMSDSKTKDNQKTKKEKKSYNQNQYLNNNQINHETIKSFLYRFNQNLTQTFDIKPESKIIVAVSGGVDSIVLLDTLFQLTRTMNIKLFVCHFNHKLRQDASEMDETFVRNVSKKYGVNFYTDSGDVKSYAKDHSQSIELAARNLRFTFFERIAKSLNINYIALAHTADDSAETMMFNFLRGSGLTGLSGIPESRNLSKKIKIIRPFIKFRKNELIEYAKYRNLKWREDDSNSLLIYTRNKIRHELMKNIEKEFNPKIIETLNRTAQIIRSADNFIQEHINPYLKSFKWNKDSQTLFIQIQLIKSTDKFLQGEIIKNQLETRYRLSGLSQSIIERVLNLINLEVGSIVQINNNIIALRERNQIIITKSKQSEKVYHNVQRTGIYVFDSYNITLSEVPKKSVKLGTDANTEFLDYEKVPALLTIRNWESGDSIKPLGMNGRVKISDFLINNKVSLFNKRNILVLSSKSDIIWICGHRINDDYKITESTSRFLKITIKFNNENE